MVKSNKALSIEWQINDGNGDVVETIITDCDTLSEGASQISRYCELLATAVNFVDCFSAVRLNTLKKATGEIENVWSGNGSKVFGSGTESIYGNGARATPIERATARAIEQDRKKSDATGAASEL